MRIRIPGLALAALILLAPVAAARFHARLVRAEPGVDAVVKTAPTKIGLTFNQPVTPGLTNATILTPDSATVATVAFAKTADSLTVAGPLSAPLRPGSYRVRWRSMSADGHPIRGEYRFSFTP